MALSFFKSAVRVNLRLLGSRLASTAPKSETVVEESEIRKSVFISQSNDIFANLALEDWMYRNSDFSKHHVMLLWRNEPCVVIGRHQNPWLEANMEFLEEKGISLARRNSGGGTVYHDKGNLNVTFFTPRGRYNRKNNLQILAKTLEREWEIRAEINKREDMVLETTNKISGTASKLGRPNAYHHCTLLIDVDKTLLSKALRRNESVPSPTVNLSEVHRGIGMDRLVTALGWEFLRTTPITQEDGGWDLVSKQRGFQMINPTDEWFPGLGEIQEEFESWGWRYGKTPQFTVRKLVRVGDTTLTMTVEVEQGIVGDLSLKLPPGYSWGDGAQGTDTVKVVASVKGQRYSDDIMGVLERAVRNQAPAFLSHKRFAAASF